MPYKITAYDIHKSTHADCIRFMSDEKLAENNVRSIIVSGGYRVYTLFITSDGYQTESKENAIKHELDWLRQPEEDGTPCEP